MYDIGQVRYPLDVIEYVSGKARLVDFVNYLFENAMEFDNEMKQKKGEDFFPVLRYNAVGFLYEIEYEFFVEIYIKYVVEKYGIDEESEVKMKQYLMLSLNEKIREVRYMFFVCTLGKYYRLGDKYYGDYCKNKYQVFINTILKNKQKKLKIAKYVPMRNFVDELLNIEGVELEKIKSEKYEIEVFGAKKVADYVKANADMVLEKIYTYE